jgi:hypothetical protein
MSALSPRSLKTGSCINGRKTLATGMMTTVRAFIIYPFSYHLPERAEGAWI